jgi:hypothetical protein
MLALVAACSFRHGVGIGGGSGDAPTGNDGPQVICYGTGLAVEVCTAAPPSGTLALGGTRTVHTDPGSTDCAQLVGTTAGNYCAILATDVDIAGKLVATGSRPLVIVSTGSMTVSGTIDVASHIAGNKGPAANIGTCGSSDASASTGGGAGGSLGSPGGNGGSSPGGVAGPAITVTTLRGGCPGTIGKDYFSGVSGPPGDGGGAIDLIAVTSITITGVIDASGAGGWGGGPNNNGGQGGGSGGVIALDAPSILFSGTPRLFANGGGGGGGSDNFVGSFGFNGGDPTDPSSGGGPGGGTTDGGIGGEGGWATRSGQPGADAMNGAGNGGGGGGVGVIRVFQSPAPAGGAVSPPFS